MAADEHTRKDLKSAYELALERLERQGIDRPSPDTLAEETRDAIAEVRRKAEARLAELEILHRRRREPAEVGEDPREAEEQYVRERRRIEERRDREIARLRGDG